VGITQDHICWQLLVAVQLKIFVILVGCKHIAQMLREGQCSKSGFIHSCIFNPLTPELNPSMHRCLMRFLLGILLLELCIFLMYV
jgi:hypothetical protein